jgi:hypothetical protein
MSVGVRRIATGPKIKSKIAATTNVYGRRSASRTIHIDYTYSRGAICEGSTV